MSLHCWHCPGLTCGCNTWHVLELFAAQAAAHAGVDTACSCCTKLAERAGHTSLCAASRPSKRDLQRSLVLALNNACWLQILLQPSQQELEQRLQQRAAAHTHFMPASLLQSQLALLEVDSSCLRYGERHTLPILSPAVLSLCAVKCPGSAVEPWQANEHVL